MTRYTRVQVTRLFPSAKLPYQATPGSAGYDLFAHFDIGGVDDDHVTLLPGERAIVGTGIALSIPHGFEGQIRARSGRAIREGLAVVNGPGTIDSDFRGEIRVILINLGNEVLRIEQDDRIAQIVFNELPHVSLHEVRALDEDSGGEVIPINLRGVTGFGSTGV